MKLKLPQVTALIVAIGGLIGASTPLIMYIGDKINIKKVETSVKEIENKLSIDPQRRGLSGSHFDTKTGAMLFYNTNHTIYRVDYTNGSKYIKTKYGFIRTNR